MPTSKHPPFRHSIRRALARRIGATSDAHAIARATLDTWREMVALLTPVIGARGVDVLLRRSLHLACARFPFLGVAPDEADGAALLAGLEARLAGSDAAVALQASHALLVLFIELLATLIGEPLTERLLGAVWAPPTTEPETES